VVGQNIGKYRVLDRIGRGGMGTVYRAIDETLHREVAIKVLNAELNDPEVAKRFRAEAITVARLSHPGIATIYELFQHEGQWLMVMEFVRGETLEHMVDRMGPLSPQRAAELSMQALAALAHAHSMGVVHRDLKPANLMITETGAVKIMDFGIARVAGTEHLTNAGFMMGTPAYMAPEQVKGQEIDARADLYAMGVVFYRLTTAKLPFKGETPFAMAQSQVNDPPTPVMTLRSDLPPWVEQVIQRSLQKAPEMRFQSAVEFHEAFARCLAGLPLSTMYGSAAPTELIATPSRPMPTGGYSGALSTNPPMPPAYSGSIPTMATPTAGTSPSGAYPPPPPPSGAIPVPAPSNATGTAPVAASASMPAPKPAGATGAIVPVKRNNVAVLGGVAVVVLAAIIGGTLWMKSGSAPPPAPPPQVEPAPAPTPPPVVDPAAPPAGVAGAVDPTTPPATPPPATPPGGVAPPPTATGAAGQPPAGTSGRAGTTGTPPAGVGTPPPPGVTGRAGDPTAPVVPPTTGRAGTPADEPASFDSVKFMTVSGKRVTDEDVTVNFGGGQVAVVPRKGGVPINQMPYRRIIRATYVRAPNPKWDPELAAPTEKFDVSGVLNRARHWLVLQSKDAYSILRLDGDGWLSILQTFEARTGLKIDRPVDGK
jgi:eukaryotic-like serine/threonine-protein kinase